MAGLLGEIKSGLGFPSRIEVQERQLSLPEILSKGWRDITLLSLSALMQ
jgi:hypothetical protein